MENTQVLNEDNAMVNQELLLGAIDRILIKSSIARRVSDVQVIYESLINEFSLEALNNIQLYFKFCIENDELETNENNIKHHLLPSSIFPKFKNLNIYIWNKIVLSYENHYIAHSLLADITKHKKAIVAWNLMNNNTKYETLAGDILLGSKLFASLKRSSKQNQSLIMGKVVHFEGEAMKESKRRSILSSRTKTQGEVGNRIIDGSVKKRKETMNKVNPDTNNQRKLDAILKGIDTKRKMFIINGEKTNKLEEQGKKIQNYMLTKTEDGETNAAINSKKANITKNKIFIKDGVETTILIETNIKKLKTMKEKVLVDNIEYTKDELRIIKSLETREKISRRFNVFKGENILYNNITLKKVRELYCKLDIRDKSNPLGSNKISANRFINNNKEHLIGLYVEEIK